MKASVMYLLSAFLQLGSVAAAGFLSSSSHDKVVTKTGSGSKNVMQTQLHMSVPNPLDTFTSGLASILRMPMGVTVPSDIVKSSSTSEIKLMKLFDIENSPECRIVRERITELDLVVEKVVPATENSRAIQDPTFEHALPPGAEVPSLIVALPSGEQMVISGSSKIAAFLDESFANASSSATAEAEPLKAIMEVLKLVGSQAAALLRVGRGTMVSPAVTSSPNVNRPQKPLVLYSYEGNQFCRLVREVLTELDIVYELRSTGKGSPRRVELAELTGGSTICPYLIDPNTGVAMAESSDIINYLYSTYALWTPPNELLEWVSDNLMPVIKPLFSAFAPLQAGSGDADEDSYQELMGEAMEEIESETSSHPVVVYTYDLSPFSFETKALLDNLKVTYKDISLGKEWIPGLLAPKGAMKRAALLEMTGQSSLPHIFVGGKSIGGLFSGEPGLIPALREGKFLEWVQEAISPSKPELKVSGSKSPNGSTPPSEENDDSVVSRPTFLEWVQEAISPSKPELKVSGSKSPNGSTPPSEENDDSVVSRPTMDSLQSKVAAL